MPLWIPQVALALAIIVTVGSGLWLMINARAVARLFGRGSEIEPGPGPRTASRGATWAVIAAFNLGWVASVAIWTWAMGTEDAIETRR